MTLLDPTTPHHTGPLDGSGAAVGGRRAGAAALDAAILGALALGGYLWLGQSTVYGDGFVFLLRTIDGAYDQRNHPAFLPALVGFRRLVSPLGLSQYEAYRLFSQLGTAAGVAAATLALRLVGLGRGRAWLAGALVAASPSVVFYATVVEISGPFFALLGLVMLLGVLAARRPTLWRALGLGACSGLANLFHASAVMLPAALAPLLLAAPRPDATAAARPQATAAAPRGGLSPVGLFAAVCAAHALATALSRGWVEWTYTGPPGPQVAGFIAEHARWALRQPEAALVSVWHEWLLPFAPLSVLWLAAARWPATRRAGALFGAGLALYLAASFLILGARAVERGAYLAAMVWPAAWLAARSLRRRWLGLATVAALVAAVVEVKSHDRPEQPAEFAAGVREIAGGREVLLLVGGFDDVEACFVELPDTRFVFLPDSAFFAAAEQSLPLLDRHVAQLLGDGAVVMLTDSAVQRLSDSEVQAARPGLARTIDHLRQRYTWRRVAVRGFRGYELGQLDGR